MFLSSLHLQKSENTSVSAALTRGVKTVNRSADLHPDTSYCKPNVSSLSQTLIPAAVSDGGGGVLFL